MGFFSELFGFEEVGYEETRAALLELATFQEVPSNADVSYFRERCEFRLPRGAGGNENEAVVSAGIFSLPSVAELRDRARKAADAYQQGTCANSSNTDGTAAARISVRTIIGEARSLHQDETHVPAGTGAVIQAASQFNTLEMPGPSVIPESGIAGYVHDRTQGPACAVACAAGTAYRNYLVPVPFEAASSSEESQSQNDRRGQTARRQLNGLEDLEKYLSQEVGLKDTPWKVKNGYVESSLGKLGPLNSLLNPSLPSTDDLREALISRLRIGVQEETAVTDVEPYNDRLVTQTYNSAVSVGYSLLPDQAWEPVARVVLDGTYEATLLVGVIKTVEALEKGAAAPPPILLTQVGGGVFRNKEEWIQGGMDRAIERVTRFQVPLDIRVVQFGFV